MQLKPPKKKQSKRSLFDNGEMAATLPPQPRFQAVGLAYLSVKQESSDRKLCFYKDTCPLYVDTCPKTHLRRRKRGGRRGEASGWEKKRNPAT